MPDITSAEAFHISEYIQDEMDARGWDRDELATRMLAPGGDWSVERLALDLLMEVRSKAVRLGGQAEGLARAFGTSAALWERLHTAWLTHPLAVETREEGATDDHR